MARVRRLVPGSFILLLRDQLARGANAPLDQRGQNTNDLKVLLTILFSSNFIDLPVRVVLAARVLLEFPGLSTRVLL